MLRGWMRAFGSCHALSVGNSLGQTGLPAQSPMREYGNTRSNAAQDQPADATRQLFPLLKIALRITLHVPQRDTLSSREPVNPVSRKVEAMDGYRSVRCFIVDICVHTARRVVFHGTGKHRIGALHYGFLGIEFEPGFREQLAAASEQANRCKNAALEGTG